MSAPKPWQRRNRWEQSGLATSSVRQHSGPWGYDPNSRAGRALSGIAKLASEGKWLD